MRVSPSPSVNPVSLLQSENALVPMLVTLSGITSSPVNSLHPANAELPISITPSPIVNSVSLLQLKNALAPMLVTPFSITIASIFSL